VPSFEMRDVSAGADSSQHMRKLKHIWLCWQTFGAYPRMRRGTGR
jgi:hypothetical protein